MHLIYSKLKSPNVLNGMIGKKTFSVEFKPEDTTKVKDEEYKALMEQEGSIFAILHESGDFIEKAEKETGDIASLEGNLVKAQKALDDAKKEQAKTDKNPVKLAEDALLEAEDALEKATNADEKKAAMKAIKIAKSALTKAQNAAK